MLDLMNQLEECLSEMREFSGYTPSTTKYLVEVVETRKKIVEVEMPAGSYYTAKQSVADMYESGDLKLGEDCIDEVEVSVSDIIEKED